MKTVASEVFVDAVNIPPTIIQETDDRIGEGRYGTCAKVVLHGMVACAKTLRNSNYRSKSSIIHEAMMLSKVRSPHICLLLGIQITKEPYQLITALYSINEVSVSVYDTLSAVTTVGAKKSVVEFVRPLLTLKAWLTLMMNLADSLAFIHSKSIVHRDLKSDNVVLHKEGETIRCTLVDFGKSNYVNKISRYQLTEQEKKQYRQDHKHIAPDLVDGISDVTTASDIYSYGRLLKNIIHYFPLPIANISTSLQKNIKKCLKYEYSDRPSAKQMAEILNTMHTCL